MGYNTLAVVGSQWGDEGKGKITDYLAEKAEVVVRYQGGPNAGHTVVVKDDTFKLHHLPSGVLYPDKTCILGNGMVLDPPVLLDELKALQGRGIVPQKLFISDRAHLIMPYHKKMDELEEKSRGAEKIGTTMRGVGPAYMDKYFREGLRTGDLLDEKEFALRLAFILEVKNRLFAGVYGEEGFTVNRIEEECLAAARELLPYLTDTSLLLNRELDRGARVLFEGAQGTMLDIDHGTYPYVTSSNPVAGGICTGLGVAPSRVSRVMGVTKAYTTRVGDGPFPTELKDIIGDRIRERGREYGTTTGRPRRIGWLDGVALRHAARINGFNSLAITLFDVLSGLDEVKIATAYRCEGRRLEEFPAGLGILEKCDPVYESMPGWEEDVTETGRMELLPRQAQQYLKAVEEVINVPIALVSVGPRRDQTIAAGHLPLGG